MSYQNQEERKQQGRNINQENKTSSTPITQRYADNRPEMQSAAQLYAAIRANTIANRPSYMAGSNPPKQRQQSKNNVLQRKVSKVYINLIVEGFPRKKGNFNENFSQYINRIKKEEFNGYQVWEDSKLENRWLEEEAIKTWFPELREEVATIKRTKALPVTLVWNTLKVSKANKQKVKGNIQAYQSLEDDLKNGENYNQETGKPNFRNAHTDDTGIGQWKLQADLKERGSGSVDRLHINVKVTKEIRVEIIDLSINTH